MRLRWRLGTSCLGVLAWLRAASIVRGCTEDRRRTLVYQHVVRAVVAARFSEPYPYEQ